MRQTITRLVTVADATASGEGLVVPTSLSPLVIEGSDRVRLFLNVTALTGSTPVVDVTVVHVIDGVDFVVGTFTTLGTGAATESILVQACPVDLKAVYTLTSGTLTDFDATVDCMRF